MFAWMCTRSFPVRLTAAGVASEAPTTASGMARPSNVVPKSAGDWLRVSFETLAAWNPDLVVRPDTAENTRAFARAFADVRWRLVPAVKEGRVVIVPGGLLERPGPRLVEALERLAAVRVP